MPEILNQYVLDHDQPSSNLNQILKHAGPRPVSTYDPSSTEAEDAGGLSSLPLKPVVSQQKMQMDRLDSAFPTQFEPGNWGEDSTTCTELSMSEPVSTSHAGSDSYFPRFAPSNWGMGDDSTTCTDLTDLTEMSDTDDEPIFSSDPISTIPRVTNQLQQSAKQLLILPGHHPSAPCNNDTTSEQLVGSQQQQPAERSRQQQPAERSSQPAERSSQPAEEMKPAALEAAAATAEVAKVTNSPLHRRRPRRAQLPEQARAVVAQLPTVVQSYVNNVHSTFVLPCEAEHACRVRTAAVVVLQLWAVSCAPLLAILSAVLVSVSCRSPNAPELIDISHFLKPTTNGLRDVVALVPPVELLPGGTLQCATNSDFDLHLQALL